MMRRWAQIEKEKILGSSEFVVRSVMGNEVAELIDTVKLIQ